MTIPSALFCRSLDSADRLRTLQLPMEPSLARFLACFSPGIGFDGSLRGERAPKALSAKRGASWVSAYALTNDYAAGAAHFVRRYSRLVHGAPGRSFFGQRREVVPAGTGVEVSVDHAAHPVRRDQRDKG